MTKRQIERAVKNAVNYSVAADPDAYQAAIACCRGWYQRAIVAGSARMSGADLTGKASNWGGRYRESRCNLLARMTRAGVKWSIRTGVHGRKILVIGA